MLELSRDGEAVSWPAGWTETTARAALDERPVEALAKKPRVESQPEAVRTSGSTPVSARPKAVQTVRAAQVERGNGHPLPVFGSGHDLRLSGEVVWCRKCGRYGEERVRADGLGGRCKGARFANHTQIGLLRGGYHPRTGHALPPDVAYHR